MENIRRGMEKIKTFYRAHAVVNSKKTEHQNILGTGSAPVTLFLEGMKIFGGRSYPTDSVVAT